MHRSSHVRAMQSILAMTLLFGMGGGCVAIYGFDDFEKSPPVSCKVREECPGNDLCSLRECVQGLCKRTNPVPADIYPDVQIDGDCKRIKCDGKGGEILEADSTDVPEDFNECTADKCNNGIPENNPTSNHPCGTTMPKLRCNDSGFCAGCVMAEDCGLTNSPCATFTCENAVCARNPRNVGLVLDNPILGDCKALVCSVSGTVQEEFVESDAPQDSDPCTIETCSADGTFVSNTAPDGTKCGDCMLCVNGTCGDCSKAASDCFGVECIPKPTACSIPSDCATGYCVDGFCCDMECQSPCMACANAKTGLPSGHCAPITDGMDPDLECNKPAGDTCRGASCGCENGIRDGNEAGVDCGGACDPCTGQWNCGGSTCDGIGTVEECCWPFCDWCPNESAKCKMIDGQTCALGAADIDLKVGNGPGNCFGDPRVCRGVTCKCQ